MIQSVHCPSCETRYGLRRARVRPGLRRAQCFRCNAVFGVEAEVRLLLEEGPADEVPQDEVTLESLPSLRLPDLHPEPEPELDAELELPSFEELEQAAASLESEALPPVAEALARLDELGAPEEEAPLPTGEAQLEVEAFPELSAAQEAMAYESGVPAPEAAPAMEPGPAAALEPPQAAPPEIEPEPEEMLTSGGYSSARDAIDKLLGQAPPVAPYRPPSPRPGGAQMDVEATLSALETTLSGVSLPETPAPPAPGAPPAKVLEPADLPPPAGATVRLSREEVAAAVASLQFQAPAPAPPSEPTMILKAPPAPLPASSTATQPGMDPNLLKVQLGTEIFSNLTMEQLASLAEQGRLMEYHMVARQFSDNWLEAGKVPGLRPVFERLRRLRLPEPPPALEPPRKSLFGGLFGKGNA